MTRPFEPTQFGRYLLSERIAVGGMAEILFAKVFGAMGFEKSLVIKRILPQFAEDSDFLRMFITEAKLVCHLEHPNIVQVHELGETEGQYYISMEYVNGIDGRQLWRTLAKRKQRLPGVLALFVACEFLKGLDYAHRAVGPNAQLLGVVHRDVSPSNVLISFRGDVKIGDFGIALVQQESKTQAGVLKGKFGYMSPEQVAGLKVDHRSDIFAAGIVLAELLLGRRLFLGTSDFETLDKVMNVRLDVLEEHAHALPAEAVHIVRQALQRDINDRYQSAREFYEDINEYLFQQGHRITNETLAAFMAEHVTPYLAPTDSGARAASRSSQSRSQWPSDPAGHLQMANPNIPVTPGPRAAAVDAGPGTGPPGQSRSGTPVGPGRRSSSVVPPPGHAAPGHPREEDGLLEPHGADPAPFSGSESPTVAPRRASQALRGGTGDGRVEPLVPGLSSPPPGTQHDGDHGFRAYDEDSAKTPDDGFSGINGAGEELDLDSFGHNEEELLLGLDPNLDQFDQAHGLVDRQLDDDQVQEEGREPDFRGSLASRTVAKVLFRFAVVEESGLLVLGGPKHAGKHAALLDWLHDIQLSANATITGEGAESRTCEIHLLDGQPHLATADRSEEALIAYLIQSDILSSHRVELAIKSNPHRRPIAALLAAGALAPLQISRHVVAYVLESVFDTFGWEDGTYAFYRAKQAPAESFPTGQDAMERVVNGVSHLSEAFVERYFQRLGDHGLVANRMPPARIDSFPATPTLLEVYRGLGSPRPVADAVAACGLMDQPLDALQALYLLIECELATLV